jgi:ketosteroid isomerase-like protein
MPESMNITGQSSSDTLRPTIEAFYEALFSKDADLVSRIVDEHFAPDAVLHRPESLPGGGRTEGTDAIKRFMAGATKMSGGPLDVADMSIATVVEGDGAVAVELAFPFAGQPAGALELWTISDLKVQSIRAFYWDTAGMLKAVS